MATGDQLKKLLQAYRNRDDSCFIKVAEGIIADEAAANHHALARDLRKALGEQRKGGDLVVLPSGKSATSLLNVITSHVSADKVVFPELTARKINRVLEEHKSAQRLARYGYGPKRKLLFWGPPGCGKTLTAYYVAHELGLPIGTVRLSALISSYLGDTASQLDEVFELANKTPMVLLLDEVDALGKTRDDANDVGELKRVVNSLLQSVDTFSSKESLIIAASNHEYLLDPALWRRFDDVIEFPLPSLNEIDSEFRMLLNGIKIGADIRPITERLKGFSFADIEKVLIEAVKTMILEQRTELTSEDIETQISSYRHLPSIRRAN